MKNLMLLLLMAAALAGAVPAHTQEVAEQYVSGDTSNAPPGTFGGVVVGTVTSVSGPVVLVEEDPASDSGDKGYFTVTDETEIIGLPEGGDAPAAPEDVLLVGQRVEASYAGPVAESYPTQGDAARIVLLGDGSPPPAEEVSATGTIGRLADFAEADHGITDEATGTFYGLVSSGVDLDDYANSEQRVTVYGTPLQTPVATKYPVLEVSRVELADGPGQESVAVAFELAVEGKPPADATFFGSLGHEPAFFPLADPDGLYSAATPEGYVTAGDGLPARIVRGTGMRDSRVSGAAPGEPVGTMKDFGEVRFDGDTTLPASVSFGGEEPPPEEVSATGIVKGLEAEPVVVDGIRICGLSTRAITDEATGRHYDLAGSTADLDGYVGRRVAVAGRPLASPAIEGAERCPDLDVTRVELLDGGSTPPPGGATPPPADGPGTDVDGEKTARVSDSASEKGVARILPNTGGLTLALAVGAGVVLTASGLLVSRSTR